MQMKEAMGKFERMTCNPKTLANMIETNMKIDIRAHSLRNQNSYISLPQ